MAVSKGLGHGRNKNAASKGTWPGYEDWVCNHVPVRGRVAHPQPDYPNNADCRRNAAAALGSLYRGTKNSQIERELAATVVDKCEPLHVRNSAFNGILDVEGVPRSEQPDQVDISLENIDVQLAESILRSQKSN